MGNGNTPLSPSQRAMLFAQATREYKVGQPSKIYANGQTLRFDLPKSRFLSKILLNVKGTFKATHASKTTFTEMTIGRYNLLKQVRVSINNGFNPFQISGKSLKLYNIINNLSKPDSDVFGMDTFGNTVSSSGATNTVNFTLEIPLTLNDRDAVGLILLQNDETYVTMELDLGGIVDCMTDTDVTISAESIVITPTLHTFSIPKDPNAVPDYSVIKLVNQQKDNILGDGETITKLSTGLTYRKMIIIVETDSKGTPMPHAQVQSFQIALNEGDTPYNISADTLAYQNWKDYDGALPLGVYVFDWSGQGIPNLGGGRDYIDTAQMTEFQLKTKFTGTSGSNYITVVSEKLSRMV